MGRQRSRNSRREQSRDSEIVRSSNLNDAKFKTLVIKMFNECLGRVDELVRTSPKR